MDGRIEVSDMVPDSEIQELIDDNDGRIGTDDYSEVRVGNVDDAVCFMEQMMTWILQDGDGIVTIRQNDESVAFKSSEVAWLRIIR